MGVTERIWGALTSMIKLEDKVTRQSEAIKTQQMKIENLTERIIRLETALEIGLSRAGSTNATSTHAALANKPKRLPQKPSGER
jgi:hypothetical protein